MRNAFAAEITELADRDSSIVLLSGDIGNRLFDDYKSRHPDRFLNCGVAEANMTGVAAGLAMSGMRPVTYTITPFVTTRCLEQIRVDVCYQDLPVVIVGVGAGLSYAGLGATHHSCEDIAFLRTIPGMTVVAPADAHEVRAALRAAMSHDGPVYLRIGKKGEPLVHDGVRELRLGCSIDVRAGNDVCLLSTGNIMPVALEAAERLEATGLSVRVVSFHTVKPLDEATLEDAFGGRHRLVATIEEHSRLGGLGGAVAEWRSDRETAVPLLRIGTRDEFLHESGGQEFARAWHEIDPESVTRRIAETVSSVMTELARPAAG
jgi:transketolase